MVRLRMRRQRRRGAQGQNGRRASCVQFMTMAVVHYNRELILSFTKAHGAGNDFLLTFSDQVADGADLPAMARAICERHTGMGGDGWMLVDATPAADRDATIRLFNADGSEPE